MNNLVSVIVPVYNVENYLARCLDSIIEQMYQNIEIIVIDDGSTDSSGKICDEYKEKDSRIIVLHQKNQGLSGARNSGLDLMHGDWVVFVDSDDFIHVDFIEYLLGLCMKYNVRVSQCGCVRGISDFFPKEQVLQKEKKWDFKELYLSPTREFSVTAGMKLYAAELFQKYRYPKGKIYEDEDVTFKVLYDAGAVAISNRHLYYYYMSEGSILRNNNQKIRYDFLDIFCNRISFLKMKRKKEENLISATEKELCIRLMMNYFYAAQYGLEKDRAILYRFYKEHLKKVDWRFIKSRKEKIVLRAFLLFPQMVAWIENNLHIIRRNKYRREKK